ncbi:MAG: sugar phosphate isomerase/epimerase [Phycisphaeraceae bacterium]
MSLPIALQLYTVREPLAEDLDAGLAQVASIGYRHVELAGLYGHSSQQFKDLLDKHGLTAISAHEPLHCLLNDLADVIVRAKLFGYDHVVCPYLDESERGNYGKLVQDLEKVADTLAGSGLTLCYHNHDFEWGTDSSGRRGIDVLFGSDKLQSELDLYWVAKAGDEPLQWMKKLAGRLPLLHVKDMDDTPEKGFAEVGTGVLDFDTLIGAAESCGVKYLIVEQDSNWKQSPMESARIGLENLSGMLV